MRRIRVVVSVVVVLVLAATMAALPAFAGGETDEENPKNGFGSAASHQATNKEDDGKGGLGRHTSSQEEPRDGVGNVARDEDPDGDGHVADHGCRVAGEMGDDCTEKPGNGK